MIERPLLGTIVRRATRHASHQVTAHRSPPRAVGGRSGRSLRSDTLLIRHSLTMTSGDSDKRTAHPADYDTDLDRFLTNQVATRSYSAVGDVHEQVAQRLGGADLAGPVLDLGGGNGLLARRL